MIKLELDICQHKCINLRKNAVSEYMCICFLMLATLSLILAIWIRWFAQYSHKVVQSMEKVIFTPKTQCWKRSTPEHVSHWIKSFESYSKIVKTDVMKLVEDFYYLSSCEQNENKKKHNLNCVSWETCISKPEILLNRSIEICINQIIEKRKAKIG